MKYRGTNKGLSEKGTTSHKGHFVMLQKWLYLQEEDSLSTMDTMAGPKVSFIRRFHCIPNVLKLKYSIELAHTVPSEHLANTQNCSSAQLSSIS